MRFIIGAVAGFAAGVAAATLTAGKSAEDLRAEIERFRLEVQKGDMDALGSHIEERFKDLQAGLEQRISQLGSSAQEVADDATGKAKKAADEAADKADDIADQVGDAVEDAAEAASA
jgi:gas vesicle protein